MGQKIFLQKYFCASISKICGVWSENLRRSTSRIFAIVIIVLFRQDETR